jgi:hypothetical protein
MLLTRMLNEVLFYSLAYSLKLFCFTRTDFLECFTGKVSFWDDVLNTKPDSADAGLMQSV